MTEEEINNLAEKHCNEVLCNAHEKCHEVIKCRDWRSRRAGFFCGYEQAVKDMEQENNKLLDVINNQDVKIADLENQLEEEQEVNSIENFVWDNMNKQLEQAKGLIKEFVEWANWQGANCPNFKDIQSKAEQLLKENK